MLHLAHDRGLLRFHGQQQNRADPEAFHALLQACWQKEWVVYAKPPFGGPAQVLKYLARYTHRVAISNGRLVKVEEDRVFFLWKDYADGNQQKVMALEAVEFIRRFLLHVVPSGFVRIRHYGLMGNRVRAENLARCRALLELGQGSGAGSAAPPSDPPQRNPTDTVMQTRCPVCGQGNCRAVVGIGIEMVMLLTVGERVVAKLDHAIERNNLQHFLLVPPKARSEKCWTDYTPPQRIRLALRFESPGGHSGGGRWMPVLIDERI
jgi:hypothetical protein